jgi:3',5'-cyclic AMP phosphodiesterase CpdA
MQVVQISDTHYLTDGLVDGVANSVYNNKEVIKYLNNRIQPDVYVISGDLVQNPSFEEYERFNDLISTLKAPVYVLPGNHDHKKYFVDVFKDKCPAVQETLPEICYALEVDGVAIIVLDTSIANINAMKFTKASQMWLEKQLAKYENLSVMVFTHHPPFRTHLSSTNYPIENGESVGEVLSKHKNIKLCTGHMHGEISTLWHGFPVQACPSVSIIRELDLVEGAPERYAGGEPAFVLHHYIDDHFISHTRTIQIGNKYKGPYEW